MRYIVASLCACVAFVGCGGDVHEVTPGESNLQEKMGVVTPKSKVLFPKKASEKVESKVESTPKEAPTKPEVVEPKKTTTKSLEVKDDHDTKDEKSRDVSKALATLSTPKKQAEETTHESFSNQYILAQEQIKKDLKIAQIQSTSQLAVAQIKVKKEAQIKEKELVASLQTSQLTHDIQAKEIATDLEKTKISKVIKEQELSNKLEQIKLQNELSLEEQKNEAVISHERMGLYKMIMMVASLLVLITLFMVYFISKRNRQMKMQLQENEILKEREMQILEHQNQRVNKMLEIVSGQNLSDNVEKELLESIKDANKTIWMVEDKKSGKKKGIIFKS